MDFEKDYYADLGVLPDVSKEVIRAVYLALAKRFHPDTGGEHADLEKFKTINAAYEILYDENSRKKYDEGRAEHQQSSYNQDVDDEEDLFDDELVDDWEFAVEYYPELEEMRRQVSAISSTLSVVFQSTVLSTKSFGSATKIKEEIVEHFVERYFGKNAEVKAFALIALNEGRRDVAKELNKAVLVFGDALNPKTIIPKIAKKFGFEVAEAKPHRGKTDKYTEYKGYQIAQNFRNMYEIFENWERVDGGNQFTTIEGAKSHIEHMLFKMSSEY